MQQIDYDFTELVQRFQFDGRFLEAAPHGNGHIHDTYAVWFENSRGHKHRYILQRINNNVFKNPVVVMENIEQVTQYLRQKISVAGGDPQRETLNLIPATEDRFL